MKAFILSLIILIILVTSCKKTENVQPITANQFLAGKWILKECKTNEKITPCGTILYPFPQNPNVARTIKIYSELQFSLDEKLFVTDCSNNSKELKGYQGAGFSSEIYGSAPAFKNNEYGELQFSSNGLFDEGMTTRFTTDANNNKIITLHLHQSYLYDHGSIYTVNWEWVNYTHDCLFEKVTEK